MFLLDIQDGHNYKGFQPRCQIDLGVNMRIYSKNETKWKENVLFYSGKPVMEVVQDETYQTMWRIKYPDGVLSADMYNKTRAKDHCETEFLKTINLETEDTE